MSTSDNDAEKENGSSEDGGSASKKKTLKGMGFKVPPPRKREEDEPKRPTGEDFAAEATEMADQIASEMMGDIDALLAKNAPSTATPSGPSDDEAAPPPPDTLPPSMLESVAPGDAGSEGERGATPTLPSSALENVAPGGTESEQRPAAPTLPSSALENVASEQQRPAEDEQPWEGDFPDEKTQVAEHELEFPEDERAPPRRQTPQPDSDTDPELHAGPPRPDAGQAPPPPRAVAGEGNEHDDPARYDDTPVTGAPPFDEFGEDSLPEPIRQRIPTLDPRGAVVGQPPSSSSDRLPQQIAPPEGSAPFRGGEAEGPGQDFEGGATEVLDSPFESDPAVAKLVALDGPATGMEVFVSGLRSTVGRGANNSVVVADLAMSRQHFEIVKNPDESFTVRDLQSINGTSLNGTKIREADLFHGDRLEAGKSLFQFVVTGNVPMAKRQRRVVPAANATMGGEKRKSAPAPRASSSADGSVKRMLTWVSITAMVVSLLLISALVLHRLSTKDDSAPKAEGPTAAAVYLEGVEAVKAREWDLAEQSFQQARELDPTLNGIDDQLRRIETERQAQASLATARELMEAGEHEAATEATRQIPRDSLYFAEARDLLRQARKAEIERLYADAQRALTEEDIDESKNAVESILARIPNHVGARKLSERIDAIERGDQTVEEAAEATRVAVAKQKEDRAELAAVDDGSTRADDSDPAPATEDDWGIELIGVDDSDSKRGSSKRKGTKKRGRVPNFTEGFLLYRTGKYSRAREFFESAAEDGGPAADRAERIAEAIGQFETTYEQGLKAADQGRWAEAEGKLVTARRADATVGDYFAGELNTKLATVRANLGLDRADAGDLSAARKHYDDARALNENDKATRRLGRRLEKDASALYVKALNQRKTDPASAAKLCRTIMRVVPESNAYHGKARDLLEKL